MNKIFMLNKKFESLNNILIKYYVFKNINSINQKFNRHLLSKPEI